MGLFPTHAFFFEVVNDALVLRAILLRICKSQSKNHLQSVGKTCFFTVCMLVLEPNTSATMVRDESGREHTITYRICIA